MHTSGKREARVKEFALTVVIRDTIEVMGGIERFLFGVAILCRRARQRIDDGDLRKRAVKL